MCSQTICHWPHKWGASKHTHRAHTHNTSDSIVHHKSRTEFAGFPPRSPQCTTSQKAPKFSSFPAGGDEIGMRRAPPGVTVHRREAYTSHSGVASDSETEAFEPEAFFCLGGIVAVEEQQRNSGSREVNRESRIAPPQIWGIEIHSLWFTCISGSFPPNFRVFRYFWHVGNRARPLFMNQVLFIWPQKPWLCFTCSQANSMNRCFSQYLISGSRSMT